MDAQLLHKRPGAQLVVVWSACVWPHKNLPDCVSAHSDGCHSHHRLLLKRIRNLHTSGGLGSPRSRCCSLLHRRLSSLCLHPAGGARLRPRVSCKGPDPRHLPKAPPPHPIHHTGLGFNVGIWGGDTFQAVALWGHSLTLGGTLALWGHSLAFWRHSLALAGRHTVCSIVL